MYDILFIGLVHKSAKLFTHGNVSVSGVLSHFINSSTSLVCELFMFEKNVNFTFILVLFHIFKKRHLKWSSLKLQTFNLCFSIHYLKRPGAALDSGSIVANLVLDDPTRVVQVRCS